MAEKKKNNKKEVKKNNTIKTSNNVKESAKKDAQVSLKTKEIKKEKKFKTWFNNLSINTIMVFGICVICILLIVLICVATKETKTTKGDDIVVKVDGKTITADELYKNLKDASGMKTAIDLIDEYILNKEYKTTDDMKKTAETTISNYKSNYKDNYKSFLEYNGIKDDAELKELLIKNSKITKATEDYIKDNLTKKEMNDYYEDSIYGDIEAKHILISTETSDSATDEEKETKDKEAKAKAEEVIKKLKDGAKFEDLAKEYSDDTSTKEKGGDLGYFNTGAMVQEFEDAAYKLKVNEYTTEPVKTTYGYHIIMKTAEKEKPSFKKSKDTIIEKLVEKKKDEDENISTKAINALREKYHINIKDKSIKKSYKTYLHDSTTTTTTTTTSQNS